MRSSARARHSISAALRAGFDQGLASYREQLLLDGHDEDFDQAFAVADEVAGWFDRLSAASFWAVIHELRPHSVVEIGSYLGRSTVFIAEALRRAGILDAELHSIDPHTGDRQHLESLGLSSLPTLDLFKAFLATSGNFDAVQIHVARSSDALSEFMQPLDFVFVDGWHAYDAVLADVRGYGKLLSKGGLMCIDDVKKYVEVDQASRQGAAEIGLTHYGTIGWKAWLGRSDEPPECLRATLRFQSRLDRLAQIQRGSFRGARGYAARFRGLSPRADAPA